MSTRRWLGGLARRARLALLPLCCLTAEAWGQQGGEAYYTVRLNSLASPRLTITADLPLGDDTLHAAATRPCDLDALCQQGWPLLVHGLRVRAANGQALEVAALGANGWLVRGARPGRVTVQYDVDYRLLAENHWPAPREAAYADGRAFYTTGRPLFLGTAAITRARIRFLLPRGVRAVAGWTRTAADSNSFVAAGFDELTDNGVVLSSDAPAPVEAGNFTLETGLFGRWREHPAAVTRLLSAHLATFTRLLGYDERGSYLAVFLDDPELGGEAFTSSYALSASPDSSVSAWGRLIGHEVFHFWNGQRIRGEDYTGSQWFQEGVTEYVAILSMARNGFSSPEQTLRQLSAHLRAHRQFGKSLVASGRRKDRGFYGTATMVALALDLEIRAGSGNRRSLDDLLRVMWQRFGRTGQPYLQSDVLRLASELAGRDLAEFFEVHVAGDVPLPMTSVLATAGLRTSGSGADEEIVVDPQAPATARQLWQAVTRGR